MEKGTGGAEKWNENKMMPSLEKYAYLYYFRPFTLIPRGNAMVILFRQL